MKTEVHIAAAAVIIIFINNNTKIYLKKPSLIGIIQDWPSLSHQQST